MNPMPSNAVFTGARPSIAPRQTPRQTPREKQLDTLQTQPFSKKRSADARAVMHKAGQQHARWHNPFIAHAMPAVLSVQRHLADQSLNQPEVRLQLVQELRLCRERLAQAGLDAGQINDASYLLCTYLDEVVSDFARQRAQTPYLEEPSLLVEFHGDAWGGEDAFTNLEHWIAQDPAPLLLLGFYALVLSLGWQGRYRVRDRGEVLLLDLRAQLHAVVWGQAGPPTLGSDLIHPAPAKQTGWSWRQKISGVTLVAVVLYGLANLMLDLYGRPVRAALAAWEPPIRTINLAQQLPPPLPELLGEGWLSAYKHPQGWLLVFKSDGAFGVGKAEFTPQFVNNIERLAQALAPWPGELEVIGHTDTQPIKFSHFPSNLELSKARAQTAAQILRNYASKGGANAADNTVARAITASGRGDTEPVDSNRTPLAFEKNRRVDVLWKVAPGLHSPNHTHTLGNPNPAAPALSNAP
jgi:type VI secretion system protein ImpK